MQILEAAYAVETHDEVTETSSSVDGGILSSLGINGTLFAFQLMNFAIVFLILWFLILKPLSKKLAERQNIINESIDNSKKIEEMLKLGEKNYQDRMEVAKAEANALLEKTKIEADIIADEAKIKTKNDVNVLVEQAKNNIAAEKSEMISELKKETATLVTAALEKILDEKIDDNKDKKLITDALSQLNK